MSTANLPASGSLRANPFVGPRALRINEREKLFGRDRALRELRALLVAERIVLLHSPSGAGKTSLIQAGLIPELRKRRFFVLRPLRVSQELPDDAPQSVNRFLASTLLSIDDSLPQKHRLSTEQLLAHSLHSYLQHLLSLTNIPEMVLIFDQFEEILAIDPFDLAAKHEFFEQVGQALEDPRFWALFAMREDYLAALDPFLDPIPNRLKDTLRLNLLTADEARQAIQGSSARAGVQFEDQAATQLINDLRSIQIQRPDGSIAVEAGPYIEPVQLQVVCLRLWEHLFGSVDSNHEARISIDDLQVLGDVDQTLADYYDQHVQAVAEKHGVPERAIRDWFTNQLITVDRRRNQVLKQAQESAGLPNEVITGLIDSHLVRGEERRTMTWYELAHDRLIDPILESNIAWKAANYSLLQMRAEIWEQRQRDENLLLSGKLFAEAREWAMEHTDELTATDIAFLRACRRNEKLKRGRLLVRSILIVALVILLLISTAAWWFAQQAEANQRLAEESALISRVLQLSTQARQNSEHKPQFALLSALTALEVADEHSVQASGYDSLRTVFATTGGQALRGHTGQVRVMAFSPDNQWLATGDDDGTIRIWRPSQPEKPVWVLTDHATPIRDLAFSNDARWLASGSSVGSVWLWDVRTFSNSTQPKPIRLPASAHQDVLQIAFSPDSRWLITSNLDKTVRIWSITDQTLQYNITLNNTGSALTVSPDGRWVAVGTEQGELWVFDLTDSSQEISQPITPNNAIYALAFAPNSNQLFIGYMDGTVQCSAIVPDQIPSLTGGCTISTQSGEPITVSQIKQPGAGIHRLVVQKKALIATDTEGVLWQWANGDLTQTPIRQRDPSGAITAMTVDPDSNWVVTGDKHGSLRFWPLTAAHTPFVVHGHEDEVLALAFSPNGDWMVSSGADSDGNGSVRLWRARSPEHEPQTFRLGKNQDHIASSSTLLAASGQDKVLVWQQNALEKKPLELPIKGFISELAFSPDGQWLTAGTYDGSLWLWRTDQLTATVEPIKMHDAVIAALDFSSDSSHLLSGSYDGSVYLWDLNRPNTPQLLGTHTKQVRAMRISSQGTWLASAAQDDGGVSVWRNIAKPQQVRELQAGSSVTLDFSPDERWLAVGNREGELWLWNTEQWDTPVLTTTLHSAELRQVRFSPDNRWLATAGNDGVIQLIRLDNPHAEPITLYGHTKAIKALRFSSDGSLLASASEDNTIALWPVQKPGEASLMLYGHENRVTDLTFLVGDRLLASSGADGTVRLWRTHNSDLQSQICSITGRNPSLSEWLQLHPEESYRSLCNNIARPLDYYDNLLKQEGIAAAIHAYQEDQQRDSTLAPLVAWVIARAAGKSEQDMSQALAWYQVAYEIDPQLRGVRYDDLNTICANGSASAYLEQTLEVCNAAEGLKLNYNNIYFNRAIVLGKLGRTDEASSDLERFLDYAEGLRNDQQNIEQAEKWHADLEEGHNPFR